LDLHGTRRLQVRAPLASWPITLIFASDLLKD
jgi:hypothetical protein